MASVVVFLRRAVFGGVAGGETEQGGRGGGDAAFEGVGAAVEDFVDGVDYVVD
jgi:hypothetical protein